MSQNLPNNFAKLKMEIDQLHTLVKPLSTSWPSLILQVKYGMNGTREMDALPNHSRQ